MRGDDQHGEPPNVPRAQPVTFGNLAGMYHPATGNIAVLMVSPWGFEELCARTAYRLVGESCALLGYPCLRFDLPGTGHSAQASSDIVDSTAWRHATEMAFDYLQTISNANKVVVIGQGIGGLLAQHLAKVRPVAGLVLLAPAIQGRSYLREVAAWTAMTKGEFGITATDGPEGGLISAGFILSAATVGEIRQLAPLSDLQHDLDRILIAARPDNRGEEKLAISLAEQRQKVDMLNFGDHAAYVSSQLFGELPRTTIHNVLSWLKNHFPVSKATHVVADAKPAAAMLYAEDFSEELLRFGPDRRLFGALTRPIGPRHDQAIIIVNTGLDHSVGWGRFGVDLARGLAREGYVSLRIDLAGIGETPLWPQQKQPILYSKQANDDLQYAIDWLFENGEANQVVTAGRCSGAYPCLLTAVSDPRVKSCILINIEKMQWGPKDDVHEATRSYTMPLSVYSRSLFDLKRVKQLLKGEIPISRATRKVYRALLKVADRKLSLLLRSKSTYFTILQRFSKLEVKGVAVKLIYSRNDRGLIELYDLFGPEAAGLKRYKNVDLTIIEDSDHNLSSIAARKKAITCVEKFLAR